MWPIWLTVACVLKDGGFHIDVTCTGYLLSIATVLITSVFKAVVYASSDQALLDQKFSRVKSWIGDNGGFVHDALRLHSSVRPPYFTLKSKYDIVPTEMVSPCIGIPSEIIVDRIRALDDLQDTLTRSGCPPLYSQATAEILALFIAYHKKQGTDSMWYPMIASLSEVPPCPWLKQIRDLPELEYDEELQDVIREEKSGNDLIIKQLHTLYGELLGLSAIELLWAYAQVQATTFTGKNGNVWIPLVHYIQHDKQAPPLYHHEDGRFATWDWEDRLFKAGEELKINVDVENPLLLYISRGIVSDNL